MSSAQLTNETIVALYRFAFLMEGNGKAAEHLLTSSLSVCASQIDQLRSEKNCIALLVRKLREKCSKNGSGTETESPGCGDGEALARTFSSMPEPERSALALFYLDLFPVRDIAPLLDLSFEDFSEAIARGREFLQRAGAVAASAEPA